MILCNPDGTVCFGYDWRPHSALALALAALATATACKQNLTGAATSHPILAIQIPHSIKPAGQ